MEVLAAVERGHVRSNIALPAGLCAPLRSTAIDRYGDRLIQTTIGPTSALTYPPASSSIDRLKRSQTRDRHRTTGFAGEPMGRRAAPGPKHTPPRVADPPVPRSRQCPPPSPGNEEFVGRTIEPFKVARRYYHDPSAHVSVHATGRSS